MLLKTKVDFLTLLNLKHCYNVDQNEYKPEIFENMPTFRYFMQQNSFKLHLYFTF